MEVRDGGQTYELRGRVEKMVRWLARNAARITGPAKLQVTFDCAGKTVSAEVKRRERIE